MKTVSVRVDLAFEDYEIAMPNEWREGKDPLNDLRRAVLAQLNTGDLEIEVLEES